MALSQSNVQGTAARKLQFEDALPLALHDGRLDDVARRRLRLTQQRSRSERGDQEQASEPQVLRHVSRPPKVGKQLRGKTSRSRYLRATS